MKFLLPTFNKIMSRRRDNLFIKVKDEIRGNHYPFKF